MLRIPSFYVTFRYPPQRHHRYEEIPGDDESVHNISNGSTSVHRYAEISSDENGYPTLKRAIEIPKSNEGHPFDGGQNVTAKIRSKPKAISPVKYWTNYPPPSTPSRAHQRNPYSKALELSPSGSGQNSPSHGFYSDTSIRTDSFEMSELSPPRSWDVPRSSGKEQTFFMSSPKRQPPIGASAANELQEPFFFNAKCILPSHLQKNVSRVRKERSRSVPSSPGRTQIHLTPNKTYFDKKMMQIFHIKSNKSKSRETTLGENGNTVRRNISNSFSEPPEKQLTPKKKTVEISKMASRSPYKPTTVEIVQPKTAVITPIFQRKNHQSREEDRSNASTKRNFEKMSKTFQSTGNIFRPTKEQIYSGRIEDRLDYSQEKSYSARLKRNQSVPNFAQTFVIESGTMMRKPSQVHYKEDHGQTRTMNWQYSPKKPFGNASPIDKSRISLIDQSRSSFSNADSDYYPRCSTCFIIATVVHLITATATCAISFYLLSKVRSIKHHA